MSEERAFAVWANQKKRDPDCQDSFAFMAWKASAERVRWRTLESCPDNETVLFFCGQFMQVGRMEHNVMRQDGSKRDLFWGWFGADEAPPTHWMPLPEAPNSK